MAQTSNSDSNPIWGVNLNNAHSIENVTIIDHCEDHSNPGCFCGLSNFTFFLQTIYGNVIERPFIDTCGKSSITELFISDPACNSIEQEHPDETIEYEYSDDDRMSI